MSLAKVEEFVDHMNSQKKSELGFPAAELYKVGMAFGLTCKEVNENFLGKDKAVSRGRYLAIVPNVNVKKVAAKKPAKKVSKKADVEPVKLTKKQKKALAEADESTGVVENTEDSFVWIASPDEIQNPDKYPLHEQF